MSRLSPARGISFRGNAASGQPAECVPPLIARILSQEGFFPDSPPTWSGAPTAREAKEARERSVKRLRRFSTQNPGAHQLAEILSACGHQCRCTSGACPECGRAFQRWFVSQVQNLVGKSSPGDLKCVSVVFEDRRVAADNLMDLHAINLKRSFSAVAAKIDRLNWIVGGIDLSLNDDRQKRQGIAWQPQTYALVKGNLNTLATDLREKFGSTALVSRPVQIKRCDGSAEVISYAFKTEFVQRIAYKAELSHRQCWSTRKVSLPPRGMCRRCCGCTGRVSRAGYFCTGCA
jgi:hypothetical protein